MTGTNLAGSYPYLLNNRSPDVKYEHWVGFGCTFGGHVYIKCGAQLSGRRTELGANVVCPGCGCPRLSGNTHVCFVPESLLRSFAEKARPCNAELTSGGNAPHLCCNLQCSSLCGTCGANRGLEVTMIIQRYAGKQQSSPGP